jgi:DNA-binding NarL/FixJ family response regulator
MAIKILLVDDQVLFRDALRTLLGTMKELEVIGEAEDGAQAVRLAEDLVPDLVLMDLSLPGIDGFEATRQIRQARPQTPVLLLSGYSNQQTRQQATGAGAAALLDKSALDRLLPAIRQGEAWPATRRRRCWRGPCTSGRGRP